MKKSSIVRIISFVISAILLVTVAATPYLYGTVMASTDTELWDGTTTTAPAADPDGDGDDYLISTPAELAWVIKNGGGANYKLTNDIYLNETDKIDWATGTVSEGYTPNSWYTTDTAGNFYGTLDGDGHTVYGLYVNNTENCITALIPALRINQPTVVKNLGIDNAYFGTEGKAAAVIAQTNYNNTVTISNCYVGEKVTVKGTHAAAMLAYSGSNFTIDSCYSLATISGTTYFGFIADSWASSRTVSNCFMTGVSVSSKGGNIVCDKVYAENKGSFAGVTQITKSNMQGEDVLINSAKMPSLTDCGNFVATENYPVLRVFSRLQPEPEEPEGEIWSGKTAKKIAEGSGTENDPYKITNGAELAFALKNNGLGGSYFELTKDIYLNDVSKIDWYKNSENNEWLNCGGFNGYLDGKGFIVYGIWYPDDTETENAGLIPLLQKGSVKNVGVRKSYINATINAGALVGKTAIGGYKEIDTCFSDETVTVKYTTTANGGASGILGQAAYEPSDTVLLKIANVYTKAKLQGAVSARVNGIIGTGWQCPYTLENSYCVGSAPFYASTDNHHSWLCKNGAPLSEVYKNNYTTERAATALEYFFYVPEVDLIKGEAARVNLSGLDFENVFQIVEDGTPKLRIFTSISGEDEDPTGDRAVYTSGKGTKASPFIITTPEQLRYLLCSKNTKNKYYELGNDIYLNDVSVENWHENSPETWYTDENSEIFYGTLDGKGYKIYGLYLNNTPTPFDPEENKFDKTAAGLFPRFSVSATVANLHIRDSFVSGSGYTGAIIGKITDTETGLYAKVVGCSADATVTVKGQTVGGLVAGGTNRGLKLYSSYFTGTVESTSESRENALVGDIWGKDWEMLDCYAVGAPAYRISIVPNSIAAVYCSEWTTGAKQLSERQMRGFMARRNMSELDWKNVWTSTNTYPHQKVLPLDYAPKIYDEGKVGEVWTGYIASKYASGDGTKASPYIIETPEQLARLMRDTATAGKYYKLAADIKLNDTTGEDWTRNARSWYAGSIEFAGNFDGDGHVVSGIYINTRGTYGGLFQQVTSGAVIKKVGVTQSAITISGSGSYAGAIIGRITGWAVKDFVAPVISQCFADHTVSITSDNAGGLVGGCGMNVHFDNCFFTGRLKGSNYAGQIVANAWNTSLVITVKDSFFLSQDGAPLSGHPTGAALMELDGVYHRGTRGNVNGAVNLSLAMAQGSRATETMPLLDYNKVWKTVKDGTPVLRCFANAEKYSNKEMPEKVEISFASLGGSRCEPIYGYPMTTKLTLNMLPTPEMYGYRFEGWCYNDELCIMVEDGYFPDYNTVFYAKWIPVSYTFNFDGTLEPNYDYNSGVEHYRPGVMGYKPQYIKDDLKSIHTLSESTENPKFLLNYEHPLEVGQMYDVTVWIATDLENLATTDFEVGYTEYPDVNAPVLWKESVEVNELQQGVWVKKTFTIAAQTPYIVISTKIGESLYFDSVQVVDLGKQGELSIITDAVVTPEPETVPEVKPQKNVEPQKTSYTWFIVGGVAAAVLLVAVIIAVVMIKCKKSKKVAE